MHVLGRRIAPFGLVPRQISNFDEALRPCDATRERTRRLPNLTAEGAGQSWPFRAGSIGIEPRAQLGTAIALLRPASYRRIGGQYTYNHSNCMCAVSLCGRT